MDVKRRGRADGIRKKLLANMPGWTCWPCGLPPSVLGLPPSAFGLPSSASYRCVRLAARLRAWLKASATVSSGTAQAPAGEGPATG